MRTDSSRHPEGDSLGIIPFFYKSSSCFKEVKNPSRGHWASQNAFQSQRDILRIFSIKGPLQNIVCNIVPNIAQFFIVTNNPLEESGLPLEFSEPVAATFCRDCGFVGSDNN